MDDTTYDRLNQLALAKGVALSDYVRQLLGIKSLEQMTSEQVDASLHSATMGRLKKEAEDPRGTRYNYDLKVYKSVDKRIRLYWWTKPVTDYDAIKDSVPEKAGKWVLTMTKETQHPPGGGHPKDYVGGDWYKEKEEKKYYHRRRGLYKAINAMCRRYGHGPLYKDAQPVEAPGTEPDEGGTP